MPDTNQKTVLWPDLSPFGASLTVAFNPTLARNFLRFEVRDRETFASLSGLPACDLVHILRDAGFSYAATEVNSRAMVAHDDALSAGQLPSECEAAAATARTVAIFYSNSLVIKKEVIQQFVPATRDTNFREMPISSIKHLDYAYMPTEDFSALVSGQQQGLTEPGIFYTTPADRQLMKDLASSQMTLNELLAYSDYPPVRLAAPGALDAATRQLLAFNSLATVERIMVGQTLGGEGVPLKAPRASAALVGYGRYQDAISACGGDVEGVERVNLPHGLPAAFDHKSSRILVLKDARYLEVPNLLRLPDPTGNEPNVFKHLAFIDQVVIIYAEYESLLQAGLLDEKQWEDAGKFAAVERGVSAIYLAMEKSAATFKASSPFLDSGDVLLRSGIRQLERRTEIFPKDFRQFLNQFEDGTFAKVKARRAQLNAERVYEASIGAVLQRVRGKDAELTRREDAGEKIGGARKDYARTWLTSSELSSLSVREMVEVVKKENIWPPLDYENMHERGVEPAVAYVIRELRNGLPVDPSKGGYNVGRQSLRSAALLEMTEERCIPFVNAVSIVRDALSEVRTEADLLQAMHRIRVEGSLRMTTRESGTVEYINNHQRTNDDGFNQGAGYKFASRLLPDVDLDNNGAPSSYGLRRLLAIGHAKTADSWEWCKKARKVKVTSNDDEAEKTVIRPEPEAPHLEHIERVGFDFRDGKDVDEKMFLSVFGFRGVEYGNWLPQSERQLVLNHAFDAFMDLAAALRLPARAMSLGGELALAFGARGRGGKGSAVAHFEPGRNVMNLTRLRGAGSLAHEWGHAFDYWLSKSVGLSPTRPVSEAAQALAGSSVFRMSPAARNLVKAVNVSRTRYKTQDERLKELGTCEWRNSIATVKTILQDSIVNWISSLDRLLPENARGGEFLAFATRQMSERFIDVPELTEYEAVKFDDVDAFMRVVTTGVDAMIGKEWRERFGTYLNYPRTQLKWVNDRVARMQAIAARFDPSQHPTASVMLKDAEFYDGFRSKKYWSTRVEMFARCFEAWVQDRIEADPGCKSQYLVFGREARSMEVEHSGYPRGEERSAVAAAMEQLFLECRPELVGLMKAESSQPREANESEPSTV